MIVSKTKSIMISKKPVAYIDIDNEKRAHFEISKGRNREK